MVRARKVPLRMCTGCGEMKPKKNWFGWLKARKARYRWASPGGSRDAARTFVRIPTA